MEKNIPDEEGFMESIKEIFPEKESYTKEEVLKIAQEFFGCFMANGFLYTGIDALFNHQYGILLDKFMKEANKHAKLDISDVPECIEIDKEIQEFERFCKKYFKYDPRTQKFIKENETQKEQQGTKVLF